LKLALRSSLKDEEPQENQMIQIAEIQEAIRGEGLDGWLFFDHHERDALAYRVLDFRPAASVTRRWYYFIPAEGEPQALVHRIESSVLDPLPGNKFIYSSWSKQIDGLKSILGKSRRVAMQYSPNCAVPYVSMVDAGTVELVRGLGVDVATSAGLIQLFEARWSPDQLQLHLGAGRRVDAIRAAAFAKVRENLAAGMAIGELYVKRFILESFERVGLVADHGPIVAVNRNMSNPHYEPMDGRSEAIRRGDGLLIDMWAKLNEPDAVYYDITWTGFCGTEPPAELVRIFDAVRGARDAAIGRVKLATETGEDLRGFQVDDAARSYIDGQGFGEYFVHRTGHSIGEEVHGTGANMDNLETHDDRKVIPGTGFSIEPGIYLPDFGVRSEVNMYVGERGTMVTGEIQQELLRIA